MINSKTYNSALAIAENLTTRGFSAVAKTDSMLNSLVALSTLPYESSSSDAINYGIEIQSLTESTDGVVSSHDLEVDSVVNDLSKAVSNHISFARNTVRPLVLQLADNINTYKASNTLKEPSEVFEVRVLSIPDLLKDESFLDTLNGYQGTPVLRPELKLVLNVKPIDELTNLILTGHERTDRLVMAWLSQQDESFINNMWVSLFTDLDTSTVVTYETIEQCNVYERANYALCVFLISRRLFDTVDESSTMELSVYRNTCAQYRDYAGSMLVECLKRMALFNKTRQLVVDMQSSKYLAKVNGDVYSTWLSEGGTVETILGMIVEGDQSSSVASINQRAKQLSDRWTSYCTYYRVDQSNKQIDYYREFLASNFHILLKTLSDTEADYVTKNSSYYANVAKLLEAEIASLTTKDIDLSFDVALRLIAKCRFYYTSAYNILNDIENVAAINPNADVREAALLAVINYLSDYLADQIVLVR